MGFKETEISGKTYQYQNENEGLEFGEKEQQTLRDAVDYFHGDGRAAFRVSPHTAFVTEADEIHLHALPNQDEQCPEDAHSCLGKWDLESFSTMLDGLRVIEKGVEVDSEPRQILETMEDRMGDLELGSSTEDSDGAGNYVPRIQ
jgi:hypothetical protein